MRIRLRLLPLMLVLVVSGCNSALLQTRRENQETEQRLVDKNMELRTLDEQNQYLLAEKNRLSADLNQQSMTLDELNARLTELQRENSRIKTTTRAEQAKKAKMQQSLDTYSRKVAALSNDDQLTVEEKKKKIDALKQQIRKYLLQ